MPNHTCDWLVPVEMDTLYDNLVSTRGRSNVPTVTEKPCGKPANFIIDWGGTIYWYCAEHYEMRIEVIKSAGREDVLRRSG